MADIVDRAQELVELHLDRSLAMVKARNEIEPGDGACTDCGCEIPEKRLHAHPGARRCIPCQQRLERGGR